MEANIQELGLLGVFFGCLAEGEAALLAAAFAIKKGWLTYGLTFSIALSATLLFDWSVFLLGRYGSKQLFARFPKLNNRMDQAQQLLEKHNLLILFFYRFVYGLRTMLILALSAGSMKTGYFFAGSLVAASLWVSLYLSLGYSISYAFSQLLPYFSLTSWISLTIAIAFCILLTYWLIRRKRRRKAFQS